MITNLQNSKNPEIQSYRVAYTAKKKTESKRFRSQDLIKSRTTFCFEQLLELACVLVRIYVCAFECAHSQPVS